MTLYPVFLDLLGQRVVVIGGGKLGVRKVKGLLGAGAQVTVVSPQVHPELAALPVTLIERGYQKGDLHGARLAFACTSVDALNDQVAQDARSLGIPCNHASRPEAGDLQLGATVQRGELQVAVSTGVQLPYLSQALRDRLEAALPGDLPVATWAVRRAAALNLPEPQRALVLSTLRAEIRRAVGV